MKKSESQMMKEVINKLHEEHPVLEDVKFNESNLFEKMNINPWKVAYYKDLYERSLKEYERISDLLNKLIGIRYDHYKFNSEKMLNQREIERYYLTKDKKILKMRKIFRRKEIETKFFETCVRAYELQGWKMKEFWERKQKEYDIE
jgi:deoxyadenosine/deoxycytidine kinase